MAKEVESKVLEIGSRKSSIIKTLESLGASIQVNATLTAHTLRNADGKEIRIREQRESDWSFTINAEEKNISKQGNTKTAEEIDHKVGGNITETLKIYKDEGFQEVYFSTKKRLEYILTDSESGEKVKFAFDLYSGITGLESGVVIPEFLEIESEQRDIILKYADILDIPHKELLDWGPKELIEHYNNG